MTAPVSLPQAKQISATAMFADLVGFAALSRELGTERAYLVVTPCLRIMDEVVRKHGGSVDKYSGDKLLGVFGYPLPLEDHAQAAARAALELRRRVAEYARELGVELELHAGLNTGELVAGDIRGPVVREFHVLGDVVNTAARLNAKAPPGSIYVGETTWRGHARAARVRGAAAVRAEGQEPAGARVCAARRRRGRGGPARPGGLGRSARRARARAGGAARGGGGAGGRAGRHGGADRRRGQRQVAAAGRARARARAGRRARCSRSSACSCDRASPGRAAAELASRVLGRDVASFEEVGKALPEIFEAISRRPHVLALEDAHVLDHDALTLMEALLAGLAGRSLLALLTFRDTADAAYARLGEAARRSGARWRELPLAPLDAHAAEALLDALALDTLDPETRRRVSERAEGSPGRLLLGAFGAAALRAEQEQETLEERRRHRSREAERRRVAVLFADISGFTAMTEALGAEKAYPIVAGALNLLDEISRRHGGTVDHYLGDCVMALFGVPEAIEDAPRAAVNAAIEMRERIERYNDELGLETRLSTCTRASPPATASRATSAARSSASTR